jgi:hypothetical protein
LACREVLDCGLVGSCIALVTDPGAADCPPCPRCRMTCLIREHATLALHRRYPYRPEDRATDPGVMAESVQSDSTRAIPHQGPLPIRP